jgi:uncharacterized membrane protein
MGTAIVVAAQAHDAGIGLEQFLRTAVARSAVERAVSGAVGGALVLVALRPDMLAVRQLDDVMYEGA